MPCPGSVGSQGAQYPGVHVPCMGATAPLSFIDCFILSLSDILSDSVRFCNNYSLFRSFRYQRNSPWRIRVGKRSVSTPNFGGGYVGSPLLHVGFLWLWQMGLLSIVLSFSRDVFSVFRSAALGVQASGVTARVPSGCGFWTLEHGLNSCGAWA